MPMKRNKKFIRLATEELTPLTKRILKQMGSEGHKIEKRLKNHFCKLISDNLKSIQDDNQEPL